MDEGRERRGLAGAKGSGAEPLPRFADSHAQRKQHHERVVLSRALRMVVSSKVAGWLNLFF